MNGHNDPELPKSSLQPYYPYEDEDEIDEKNSINETTPITGVLYTTAHGIRNLNTDQLVQLKQFLIYLHKECKIPLQAIDKAMQGIFSTAMGNAIPFSLFPLIEAFPEETQARLIKPFAYAGLAAMFTGMLTGLADMAEIKDCKNPRIIWHGTTSGFNAFIFTLQASVGLYVSILRADGYSNEQINGSTSDAVLGTAAGTSFVVALAHTILWIRNEILNDKHGHARKEHWGWRVLKSLTDIFVIAAEIHALGFNWEAIANGEVNSTPSHEIPRFVIPIVGASFIAGINHFFHDKTNPVLEKFISYLEGANILTLLGMFLNHLLPESEEFSETDKLALAVLWSAMLSVPIVAPLTYRAFSYIKGLCYGSPSPTADKTEKEEGDLSQRLLTAANYDVTINTSHEEADAYPTTDSDGNEAIRLEDPTQERSYFGSHAFNYIKYCLGYGSSSASSKADADLEKAQGQNYTSTSRKYSSNTPTRGQGLFDSLDSKHSVTAESQPTLYLSNS